jgi:8-oxo-dGTP diphosphatase
LVNPDGHFILQRRDFAPGTYNPGRLSMFGGALEGAETPLECAVRELREETGMDVAESQLAFLTEATFTREDSSKTRCTIYFVSEVNPESVHVAEGLEYEIITDEQAVRDTSITPLCRTAILEYLKQR